MMLNLLRLRVLFSHSLARDPGPVSMIESGGHMTKWEETLSKFRRP